MLATASKILNLKTYVTERKMAHEKLSRSKIEISYRVRAQIALLFILFVIAPISGAIFLYESEMVLPGHNIVFIVPVFLLVMIAPITKLIEYILIRRNMKKVISFCTEVRSGNYNMRFDLPNQKDEEEDFITFLRNLEMLSDHIRGQNRQLIRMLKNTHKEARQMKELAVKDGLTGLYNRRYFDAVMADEAMRSCVRKEWLSLIMLDCDKFKSVNDTYGHSTGDAVLKMLAKTMLSGIRADKDIPFRFGGDEFGIILPGADITVALKAAKRLSASYSSKDTKGTSLSISVTAIKFKREDKIQDEIEHLISKTDKGIYDIKDSGGGNIIANTID